MPTPRRLTPPPIQLRELLAAARLEGRPFELAWNRALRSIEWPHATERRRAWKAALVETRSEWAACYERRPTAYGAAAEMLLAPIVDDPPPAVESALAAA